jgi:hypothetical protein
MRFKLIQTFLKLGMSVQMGNFGTMRLNLSGEGAETPNAFNSATIAAKVIFTPGVELKNSLQDIKFEQA